MSPHALENFSLYGYDRLTNPINWQASDGYYLKKAHILRHLHTAYSKSILSHVNNKWCVSENLWDLPSYLQKDTQGIDVTGVPKLGEAPIIVVELNLNVRGLKKTLWRFRGDYDGVLINQILLEQIRGLRTNKKCLWFSIKTGAARPILLQ